MTEIILKGYEKNRVDIHIEGDEKELVILLAASIMNDAKFATLVIAALSFIADNESKFPKINLN